MPACTTCQLVESMFHNGQKQGILHEYVQWLRKPATATTTFPGSIVLSILLVLTQLQLEIGWKRRSKRQKTAINNHSNQQYAVDKKRIECRLAFQKSRQQTPSAEYSLLAGVFVGMLTFSRWRMSELVGAVGSGASGSTIARVK
jgi:hypothetical protein